jgi:hypothetical protein
MARVLPSAVCVRATAETFRFVRRILAVLLVVPLLGGCGGETQAQKNTRAPGTPAGFTVRSVPDVGFSIAVPKRWRALDSATALRGPSLKEFERDNPAAAGAAEAIARPNSPMKLIAIDPSGGPFATNLNVLVSRIPADEPFASWTAAETADISPLRPTELRKGVVQLPAARAYRLRYHARLSIRGTPRNLAIHQYMITRGPFLYVITFTTEATKEDALAGTFESSARTFELTA